MNGSGPAVSATRTTGAESTSPISPILTAFSAGATWYRVLALFYVFWSVSRYSEHIIRPWLVATVFGVMTAWTIFSVISRRPSLWRVVVEVLIVCLGLIASGWVYPEAVRAGGVPTLTGIWAAASVLSAAVVGGPRLAVGAAAVIGAVDLLEPRINNSSTIEAVLQLLMVGLLFGWAVQVMRRLHEQLLAAAAVRERMAERERLNRVVHDGVLQTLAYIHRRGLQIGGEAAELGELAAEQERGLRALMVTSPALDRRPAQASGTARQKSEQRDVGADLMALAADRDRVEVVRPAGAVALPAHEATELRAAVAACLDNVEVHAGPQARAWVLVEDLGDEVVVTVRDDGVGLEEGRLAEAAEAGRLGAASSIRGRIEDLGGSASWTTTPGRGCTVTLTVPRPAGSLS
ncbi:MacS family sensor histidine kinase [Kribbia dieselivorans]|uniref:MacS family sensor histidine kinase n=1 Tax=Kribbia dieselivorans TaxID=331526 RepID=UPI000838E6DD|nr:DUF5931 domain-containing protein [Kribbia dieselivorans]